MPSKKDTQTAGTSGFPQRPSVFDVHEKTLFGLSLEAKPKGTSPLWRFPTESVGLSLNVFTSVKVPELILGGSQPSP